MRNRVADTHIFERLDRGDHPTYFGGTDRLDLFGLGGVAAEFGDGPTRASAHHANFVTYLQFAVENPEIHDDPAVLVVMTVEDKRASLFHLGRARVGQVAADAIEQFIDALPCLGGYRDAVFGGQPEYRFDLHGDSVRIGRGQIDLVDDGNDLEITGDGEIGVGDGLRFNALCAVDDQHRAFACRQRPGHFVGEIHVSGSVDEVELVVLALVFVMHRDRRCLDCDAPLPFQIHRVQQLLLGFAITDSLRGLQQTIGQRALAVVDMRDDGKIADGHFGWRCSENDSV